MADFADFLTSDPTEAQITEWVKSICHTLGQVQAYKIQRKDFQNKAKAICHTLGQVQAYTNLSKDICHTLAEAHT